jgi:hypothetical protein
MCVTGNDGHLDLDLLAFVHAGVFIELDGLAVNPAVESLRHGSSLLFLIVPKSASARWKSGGIGVNSKT